MERIHLLMYVLNFFMLSYTPQQVFPVYMNYSPKWTCLTNATGPVQFGRDCAVYDLCNRSQLHMEPAEFRSAALELHIVCGPTAYRTTFISTAVYLGVLLGAGTCGSVADCVGRRPVLLAIFTVGLAAGVACSALWHWLAIAACRLLVGWSCGGITTVGFSYSNEFVLPAQRVPLKALVNFGYGLLLMAAAAYAFGSWRWTQAVTAVGAALPALLLVAFVLPESPAWLAGRHKWAERRRVLDYIGRLNGKSGGGGTEETQADDCKASDKQERARQYTVLDLFATVPLAKVTLVLWLMWFTASLGSYALALNSSRLPGNFYINQFIFAGTYAVAKLSLYPLDKYCGWFNRRTMHQLGCGAMVACFAIIIALTHFDHFAWAAAGVTAVYTLSTMFMSLTWDACYLCTAELYPTVVRGNGMGAGSVCARVGALAAPQVAQLALSLWRALPFAVAAALNTAALAASIALLPDTKDVELPTELSDACRQTGGSGGKKCKGRIEIEVKVTQL